MQEGYVQPKQRPEQYLKSRSIAFRYIRTTANCPQEPMGIRPPSFSNKYSLDAKSIFSLERLTFQALRPFSMHY